jgi:hypothetical protein
MDCGALTQTQHCNTQDCGPPVKCTHIQCKLQTHSAGHSIRVTHSEEGTKEREGEMHMCKWNKQSAGCECKCFGADWVIQHGVRGAVDSGNHKIVAAFGGKLAFNSRVHGDQWATDTQGQTARGFMTSDGGAYEWSVHHVQAPQLHGGRSNAVSASGKKEVAAVVEAATRPAVAAASAAAADL